MKSILYIITNIKRKPFEFKVVDYHLLEIIYFSCIIVLLKKEKASLVKVSIFYQCEVYQFLIAMAFFQPSLGVRELICYTFEDCGCFSCT